MQIFRLIKHIKKVSQTQQSLVLVIAHLYQDINAYSFQLNNYTSE